MLRVSISRVAWASATPGSNLQLYAWRQILLFSFLAILSGFFTQELLCLGNYKEWWGLNSGQRHARQVQRDLQVRSHLLPCCLPWAETQDKPPLSSCFEGFGFCSSWSPAPPLFFLDGIAFACMCSSKMTLLMIPPYCNKKAGTGGNSQLLRLTPTEVHKRICVE